MGSWVLAAALVMTTTPPPERGSGEFVVDWGIVAAAGAGLAAGILGMLIGAGASQTLYCGVEDIFSDSKCSGFSVVPTVLGGLALGFVGGYIAVGAVRGDVGGVLPSAEPNVVSPAPLGPEVGVRVGFTF